MNIFETFGKFDLIQFISIIVITIVLYTFYKEKKVRKHNYYKRLWIEECNKIDLFWCLLHTKNKTGKVENYNYINGKALVHPESNFEVILSKLRSEEIKNFVLCSNEITNEYLDLHGPGNGVRVLLRLNPNFCNSVHYTPRIFTIQFTCTHKHINNEKLVLIMYFKYDKKAKEYLLLDINEPTLIKDED